MKASRFPTRCPLPANDSTRVRRPCTRCSTSASSVRCHSLLVTRGPRPVGFQTEYPPIALHPSSTTSAVTNRARGIRGHSDELLHILLFNYPLALQESRWYYWFDGHCTALTPLVHSTHHVGTGPLLRVRDASRVCLEGGDGTQLLLDTGGERSVRRRHISAMVTGVLHNERVEPFELFQERRHARVLAFCLLSQSACLLLAFCQTDL